MRGLILYGATGKFTWRMLATVLGGQSVIVFFGALVARAIAASGPDQARSGAYLAVGTGLALVCIVAAGLMRRPWGVTLGWVVQLLTLVSAVILPMMLVVGLIFVALWVTCLVIGTRIDIEQAARAEQALKDETADDTAGETAGDDGTGRVTG